MKTTNKNRKYKKNTNKRRKSVKNSKTAKNTKKMKGGDSIKIVAYKSLIKDNTNPTKDLFLYKIKSNREFPKTIMDTIVYQPVRDVEESLAEINYGMNVNKSDFLKYPEPKNETEIKIDYNRNKPPTIPSRP